MMITLNKIENIGVEQINIIRLNFFCPTEYYFDDDHAIDKKLAL
jgi:hypothetical protein